MRNARLVATPLRPLESEPAARLAGDVLPARAVALIAALDLAALAASAHAALVPGAIQAPLLLLMLSLGVLAERADINLYGDSRVSISALFLLTTAIILGPLAAVSVGLALALAGHVGRGRPAHKLAFNAGQFVLCGYTSAWVYRAVVAAAPEYRHLIAAAGGVAAGIADFAVASALVTLIIAATSSDPVRTIWREKFAWLVPHFILLGFLAFVLTVAYDGFGLYGLLGFVAPALMMRFTMKQYVDRTERTVRELHEKNARIEVLGAELREAYGETLTAFVSALDARDAETQGHSQRVAELSLRIARVLGVAPGSQEWQDLEHGAMLHDVGKIGVPDAILRKPGPLDEEEWSFIRRHPAHGYYMLRGVRFLANAAELVLCHHERYDGGGYPRGLRGDEIPLAARIFAVADTFDAITSERPYKHAGSVAEACAEISRNSGTQFDPRVVAVLLHLEGRTQEAA
ncbi:MAG: HD-GYP domain-containing protein [Chloroflexota bacterium]|nr:HD-GYP domain-containing protein [Chloroflexota bacterium]